MLPRKKDVNCGKHTLDTLTSVLEKFGPELDDDASAVPHPPYAAKYGYGLEDKLASRGPKLPQVDL